MQQESRGKAKGRTPLRELALSSELIRRFGFGDRTTASFPDACWTCERTRVSLTSPLRLLQEPAGGDLNNPVARRVRRVSLPILSRLPASLFQEDCSSVARIIAQKRDASTAIFVCKLRVLCGNSERRQSAQRRINTGSGACQMKVRRRGCGFAAGSTDTSSSARRQRGGSGIRGGEFVCVTGGGEAIRRRRLRGHGFRAVSPEAALPPGSGGGHYEVRASNF